MAPLIVIVGETASGKSALALYLAEHFGGEIICADSWTVRREVNIGTAKPTQKERKIVPHHLLDIVGPDEDFTAAIFKRLANEAINDISSRKRLPFLVGGTGLYIDGVIYDYGFLPEGNRVKREKWNSSSLATIQDEVRAKGIDTKGIDMQNKRRLIRLLETGGKKPSRGELRPNTLILGTKIPTQSLRERIEKRVNTMLEQGLEEEVKQLADRYGWGCEALKGIGYREWREYFLNAQNIDETREKIIKSTQDLAKRQRTWFKRNSSIQWTENKIQAVDLVTTFLNKKP